MRRRRPFRALRASRSRNILIFELIEFVSLAYSLINNNNGRRRLSLQYQLLHDRPARHHHPVGSWRSLFLSPHHQTAQGKTTKTLENMDLRHLQTTRFSTFSTLHKSNYINSPRLQRRFFRRMSVVLHDQHTRQYPRSAHLCDLPQRNRVEFEKKKSIAVHLGQLLQHEKASGRDINNGCSPRRGQGHNRRGDQP